MNCTLCNQDMPYPKQQARLLADGSRVHRKPCDLFPIVRVGERAKYYQPRYERCIPVGEAVPIAASPTPPLVKELAS